MKKLSLCFIAGGVFLFSAQASAQATRQDSATKVSQTKSIDKGSEGVPTMEEYQTLSEQFQKANPGKTFRDLSKEEFETYLTTELYKLRKKRAEEAAKKESLPKTEGEK